MTPRALLSVTDKRGIVEFGQGLVARGFQLVSTGGTAAALRAGGLDVLDVAELTGFPEMLDGRLKTLHPLVHGALLGDVRLPEHREAMTKAGISPIGIVAVNLYAFEQTVSAEHTFEQAIESIDIGGPAMLRAAAKNWANVSVIVDPDDYATVLGAIDDGSLAGRRRGLAAKVFRHTAYYDSVIARYMTEAVGVNPLESETLTVGFRRSQGFRYGENPHQAGAIFTDPLGPRGIAQARLLWGIDPGYNNWLDADGAWELVADLPAIACAITKHGNPCGAAVGKSLGEAYREARAADPVSAFGGVVAMNGVIDAEAAAAMTEKGNKLDVIVGADFTAEALDIFKNRSGWGQEVRLLAAPLPGRGVSLTLRSVRGGVLVQESDEDPGNAWSYPSKIKPTAEQIAGLEFLWRVVPHVKSNAIVVGAGQRLLGVGAGQMNRVQSARLALQQAGEDARGAVLASDAFIPFPDTVEVAAEAGIAAIVQPGGSKKDADVLAVADAAGIAMAFTGARHFRH
ncbi:MAG TPA: bifunctional phosphoribosylaminoimidazolecarboxamide formyltransferase/IMP cyclohydrolase [Fimbriimonadaceae bacterium]|nr:bifunctional phosphoribosylaminoimidazolecarboxamide formyltransferase/IMP cyclohydrolase [Fimbriimonadaceae bacterium]